MLIQTRRCSVFQFISQQQINRRVKVANGNYSANMADYRPDKTMRDYNAKIR